MKHKIFFIILLSLFFIKVNALPSSITLTNSNELSIPINNIINTPNGYSILSINNDDTSIYNYQDNELLSTKTFPSLTNSNLINYNDHLLLVGLKGTNINIYLLDDYLHIISSKEITTLTSLSSTLNLSLYNKKVYLSITNNNILASNTIYEIDESLNINENNFSSYSNIKDILKSSYYLIKYNNLINYKDSTMFYQQAILVGSKNDEALISIYENDTLIKELVNKDYLTYNKVLVIKDMLCLLATDKDYKTYLIFFDKDMNIISKDLININNNPLTNIYKVGDYLYLLSNNNVVTSIETYKYNLSLIYSPQIFGTIDIVNSAHEYDKVSLNITPNSGYEVSEITIIDAYGNHLNLIENTFIMPDTDIYLNITFNETIINPDTIDYIFIFIVILLLSVISFHYFYKKYNWLR